MTVLEVIKNAQEERGITVAELARRTDITYEKLRTSLEGQRGITAPELVSLCKELDLSLEDFKDEAD